MLKWLVVMCSFYVSTLCAQDSHINIPFTRYTVADGLAQMQVRALLMDADGYLWIGTQGGISGFDGRKMITYHDIGSISEEYIWTIARGKNMLYTSTLTATYEFDGQTVEQMFRDTSGSKYQVLFEDMHGWLWLGNGDKITVLKEDKLISIGELYPLLRNISVQAVWGDPEWDFYYLLDERNRFIAVDPITGDTPTDSLTFLATDVLAHSANSSAFRSNVLIYRVEGCVREIYRLTDSGLLKVASWSDKDGALKQLNQYAPLGYIDQGSCLAKLNVLQDSLYRSDVLRTFRHARFCLSYERKLYVGTDEGLIVVHMDGLQNYILQECDYPWSVVQASSNTVYAGCYRSGVLEIMNNEVRKRIDFPKRSRGIDLNEQILSNYFIQDQRVFFGSMHGFFYTDGTGDTLCHFDYHLPVEAIAYDKSSATIIAGSDFVFWLDSTLSRRIDSMPLPATLLGGAWANDLCISESGDLWVAANGGVLRAHDRGNEHRQSQIIDTQCKGAVCLLEDGHGTIWAGGTCGLMRFNKSYELFEQVLPDLISQRINQLVLVHSDTLVCVSNNALYVLTVADQDISVIDIFNQKNGLHLYEPSENGASVWKNRIVWLPAVEGIQRLDLSKIEQSSVQPMLLVNSINGSSVKFNPVTCEVAGTSALIELSTLDHMARDWRYQYRLGSSDFSPWQTADEILVSNLSHGNNVVTIRSCWLPSDTSTCVQRELILITKLPFLKRTVTQLLLSALALVLACIALWALYRQYTIRQRLKLLRSDLYKNRLQTIQAYLNPHFLFNTLTSIQDRILQNDTVKSNEMIVRLARVFRKVLNTARFESDPIPQIRLSEEVALIQDMVELNNAQVSIPVELHLILDEYVRLEDPLIPPLLIQPFVENAFKHAFGEDDKSKMVDIRIMIDNGFLVVVLKDNGIGFDGIRNASSEGQIGLHLANERMRILNEMGITNSIAIQKVVPHGTQVVIKIRL